MSEWISVKDRLPDNLVDVLVCTKRNDIGISIGYITANSEWRVSQTTGKPIKLELNDVSYWKELPKPPVDDGWIPTNTHQKADTTKMYWVTDGCHVILALPLFQTGDFSKVNSWHYPNYPPMLFESKKEITHFCLADEYKGKPKPPVQINVDIDKDVADIRQANVCENCRYWDRSRLPENCGKCSMLSVDNYGTLVVGDDNDMYTMGDFGCNYWEEKENKKDEIIAYFITNGVGGVKHFHPIEEENRKASMIDKCIRLNISYKGLPVYLPFYVSQSDDISLG